MVGIIGAINGGLAGATIGGFNVSVEVGAIIGAGTYLIYFFAFNGMEGRIIDAGTYFGQIMIAIVPAIAAAFAGALTAGVLNYLT